MKINCVIIEDLQVAADYLTRCCEKSGMVEIMAHFADVSNALEFLDHHNADLLFLDVEMPGSTGFELLDKLSYSPQVILTTSKEEYAYNAFQYNVADFLKKPYTYKRFTQALEKVKVPEQKQTAGHHDHLFIKTDGKLVRLNHDDILFIESMGDYVRFVTPSKKYVSPNSIRSLADKINQDHFMRVHRSYIVNLLKIDDIIENNLYINGVGIPISKSLRADILKRLTIL